MVRIHETNNRINKILSVLCFLVILTNDISAELKDENKQFTAETSRHLFVIGGFKEKRTFADVYSLPVSQLVGSVKPQWKKNGDIPKPLQGHTALAVGHRIFVIGGLEGFSGNIPLFSKTVYSAEVNDGRIQNWHKAGSLPHPLAYHAAVKQGNRIITSGGQSPGDVSSVYAVVIDENGQIGSWKMIGMLPKPMRGHASLVVQDRLFVLGGHDNREFFDRVSSAAIKPDGSIGAWEHTTPLPMPLVHFGTVAYDGRLYVLGGQDSGDKLHTEVYSAEVRGAALGQWRREPPFPHPQSRCTIHAINHSVIVTGGGFGWEPPVYAAVFSARIGNDGILETWHKIGDLPEHLAFHAAVIVPEKVR